MIKHKIGVALCAVSAAAAYFIYLLVMKYSEYLTVLKNLSFLGVYYPILFALDLILLVYSIFKDRLGLKGEGAGNAIIFAVYAALNALLAVKTRSLWDVDAYMPPIFIKAVGFAAMYVALAALAFAGNRRWSRIACAAIFVGTGAAIFAVMGKKFGDNLGLFVNAYLSLAGRQWPERLYWCTNLALTAVEMLLALVRLIGLLLYNTKHSEQIKEA